MCSAERRPCFWHPSSQEMYAALLRQGFTVSPLAARCNNLDGNSSFGGFQDPAQHFRQHLHQSSNAAKMASITSLGLILWGTRQGCQKTCRPDRAAWCGVSHGL